MNRESVNTKFKHLIDPFTYENGDECCFLIHGYTGTPSEFLPMGKFLADNGYSVHCPLLPGHGTVHRDLYKTTWKDWYKYVETEYLALKDKYKKIHVIGLSLGGGLSLELNTKHNVDTLTVLAAGTRPGDWRLPALPFVSRFVKAVKKTKNSYARGNDRLRFAYDHNPTKSTMELVNFYVELEGRLDKVKAPLLVIHSRDDIVIPYTNADILLTKTGTEIKKLVTLEKAGHIISLSEDMDTIHKEILDFIGNN